MTRHGIGRMINSSNWWRATGLLLTCFCLLPMARAGILAPEWSRPLTSPAIAASVRPGADGNEELFLLLADRRVMVVSRLDSLAELGRAPEGTTAFAAVSEFDLPAGAAPEQGVALLLAVRAGAACDLVAWNRRGQRLWAAPVPELRGIDSMTFVGWKEERAQLLTWRQGEPWLVCAGRDLASARRLSPGFIPLDALVLDLDRDREQELAFFDGRQLAVYYQRQGRELLCQWPAPPVSGRTLKSLIACAVFDSTPVLLAVTGDTLRYVDALTGVEQHRFASGPESGLPGPPRAVGACGRAAYVAGTDTEGRCYLCELDSHGPARTRLPLPLPAGALVYALCLLKNWSMLLASTGYGPEIMLLYAPGLAGTADNSPGYSGTRFVRVVTLRLDADTFPDLAVLRTAADAPWRLDVFDNRMGRLAREIDQARQALQHAALGRDENEVRRAIRRVRALERETGTGLAGPGHERSTLDRFRESLRRRSIVTDAVALLVVLLAGGLGLLARRGARRRNASARQIESQPLAARVALAAGFIAADHNFISKGNTPAAVERIIEIRNRNGLERDRDLGRLGPGAGSQELRRAYAGAVVRLINASPTLPVLDFIRSAAGSAPRGRELQTLELNTEEYRRLEAAPGVRLIAVANREYPDCHHRFRLFSDAELQGTLEHIILDHIRHAGTWADIVLSYSVSTQWNRRLSIVLRSDSPHVVPLADPRAHITSQLRQLASLLGPAIEVPRDAGALTGPYEKLWFTLTDYIAVLEETSTRLSTP
jgi:hypothetical protein